MTKTLQKFTAKTLKNWGGGGRGDKKLLFSYLQASKLQKKPSALKENIQLFKT
jgi:hypothetical protein